MGSKPHVRAWLSSAGVKSPSEFIEISNDHARTQLATLTEQAKQRFEALGIGNVIVRQADGSGGLPAEGPFDRIVAWAAFDSLPRFLLDQLSSGGIVIAPIGPEEGEQVLAKLTKVGSRFEREDIGLVRLQPILRSVAAVI